MNPQITITFASAEDYQDALRQITKAREYAYRGNQLGALGCSILLRTLERAQSITSKTATPRTKEVKPR